MKWRLLGVFLPQRLRGKYLLATGLLPIGGMFLSFWPLLVVSERFLAAKGVAMDAPLNQQEGWILWLLLFFTVMILLLLGGFILGWLLNTAIARLVLGWPPAKVSAVFLHSNCPGHWLAPDEGAGSISNWEGQRQTGMLRFVLIRGVAGWGGLMLLGIHVVPTLLNEGTFRAATTMVHVVLWGCGGAVFGAAIWYLSEANYRRRDVER